MFRRYIWVVLLFFATTVFASPVTLLQTIPKDIPYPHAVPSARSTWLKMMDHAKYQITIGSLYFSAPKKSSMTAIVSVLKSAAKRGVKVRILVDDALKSEGAVALASLKALPNISIRMINYNALTGGVMHAKYMIIDGQDSFLGSQNFSADALTQTHEMGIRIENKPLARTLTAIFDLDWQIAALGSDQQAIQHLLQTYHPKHAPVNALNPVILHDHGQLMLYPAFSPAKTTPKQFASEQTEIVRLINQAAHSIHIQVMLYSTQVWPDGYWPVIDSALRRAAARGVKIQLLVANWALRKTDLPDLKSLEILPTVQVKFVTLPEYQHKFIPYSRVEHCKYMVVDGYLSWIGTGNWEPNYFTACRDMALIIHSTYLAEQLDSIFHAVWQSQYAAVLQPDKNYQPPKTH